MISRFKVSRAFLALIGCASLLNISPTWGSVWRLSGDNLLPAEWQSAMPLPPVHRPVGMEIELVEGSVQIIASFGRWKSPSTWEVQQALWTDLNQDGDPEATLLVRRPFEPWPVDRVLPHGGRIQSHQDSEGMSSHIILIGWKKDHWGEVWAGSALARPIKQIEVADLNQDGKQELAVLEGDYKKNVSSLAGSLAIWKWNGFGFDLMSRVEKMAGRLTILKTHQFYEIILLN